MKDNLPQNIKHVSRKSYNNRSGKAQVVMKVTVFLLMAWVGVIGLLMSGCGIFIFFEIPGISLLVVVLGLLFSFLAYKEVRHVFAKDAKIDVKFFLFALFMLIVFVLPSVLSMIVQLFL